MESYRYDAEGQRIYQDGGPVGDDPTWRHFDYFPHYTVGITATQAVTKTYFFAGQPIAQRVGGKPLTYLHADHLGSTVLTTGVSGNQKYHAYGATRSGLVKTEHQFTGHELDSGTGLIYMRARYYDPVIGQFISPDTIVPDPTNVYAYNRYMYAYGNPVKYTDPTGHDPYPVFVRAFAPRRVFGGGFSGDNRGYSLEANVTSRVQQRIDFDTDSTTTSQVVWSDPSHHPLIDTATATPSGDIYQFTTAFGAEKRQWAFATEFAGNNPLVPSPNIDVMAAFSITEDREHNTLHVTGSVKGDHFPATEIFMQDPTGQAVFLGVGSAQGGPFTSLWGKNERPITEFDITIVLDAEGDFSGVWMQGAFYTLEDWNRFFEQADPLEGTS